MSLETRITALATRIGQKIKELQSLINGKVDKSGNTPDGYLKTNSSGEVTVDTTPLAPATPVDGVEYVMKDGVWIQLEKATEIDWNTGVLNKPATFTPSSHDHDDRYYTETEMDSFLQSKADSNHDHDDRYYTETEMDALLLDKEDSFVKNTGFNKNFGTSAGEVAEGNHNHDSVYYTKAAIDSLINSVGSSSHTHNDIYYTKVQIDTLLESGLEGTHNHDDRYYTESEIDTMLLGKADFEHFHDDRYYTEIEIDDIVSTLAPLSHTHSEYYEKSEVDFIASGKANNYHTHDDRYFTEAEITEKLNTLRSSIDSISVVPPEGLLVRLPSGGNLGKYTDGQTIPGGLSTLQVLQQAVSEFDNAEFFLPEATLTSSPEPSLDSGEVGDLISIDFTLNYTQNDGGSFNNYSILQDNVEIHTSPTVNTYTLPNLELTKEEVVFEGVISYDEGTGSKIDTLGVEEFNDIVAGTTISQPLSFRGHLPLFYGTRPTSIVDSSEVRANLTRVLFNEDISEMTLHTGTSDSIFYFWLPTEVTLESVTDLESGLLDITLGYTPTPLPISNLQGSGTINGNLYEFSADVPYLFSHRHLIKVSSLIYNNE
jgi:hypothetical protein